MSDYPCSELAEPPITDEEAEAVDLGRDTTLCRLHRGQYTHLNLDGRVYFVQSAVCIGGTASGRANF
jgi:hypothetical protein